MARLAPVECEGKVQYDQLTLVAASPRKYSLANFIRLLYMQDELDAW